MQSNGAVLRFFCSVCVLTGTATAADSRLLEAVQNRDARAVLALLQSGADVNARRGDGATPLAWAASRGDAEIVAALVKAGAKPDLAGDNGETPLLFACANGDLASARLLLDAKAGPNQAKWNGETPLHAAVESGNRELVRLLLDRGAEGNAKESRLGQTPLMWAAAEGRSEIVALLLERGADANATTASGYNALLFAAQKGDRKSAEALLGAKVDPNFQSRDGNTAFLTALVRGHEEVARLMLDHGAEVNTRDRAGSTPLHEAVRQGKVELARDLVKRGADLKARTSRPPGPPNPFRNSGGQTPFLVAAETGSVPMMKALLDLGADAKDRTPDGAGPLLGAVTSRKLEAVRFLVELGADVNEARPGGGTALHRATQFGANDIIEYLASNGADFNAKDRFGRNVLEEAEFEAPKPTIALVRKLAAAQVRTAAPAPPPPAVDSPVVHTDRRVTFRIYAPKAGEVTFFGDWMKVGTSEKMTRGADGVWSLTTAVLPPSIYLYTFTVDGVTMADPVNPRIKLRSRTSASMVEVPGEAGALWQIRDVPHGTVEIHWQKSKVLGDTRWIWVYTPPGYSQDTSRRYPVLYLLHGSNDIAGGWVLAGQANFIADNLLAEGKARQMIIVMPYGHAVPFGSPREVQARNTEKFESYLLEDVMPLVESQYRTAPGRRAIAGLSMGGGQALTIGLKHLDKFPSIGVFSSAAEAGKLLGAETKSRLKLLWIGCGKDDAVFPRAEAMAALFAQKGVKHTFRATEGAHTYTVWRQYLGEFLPLVF